MTTVKLTLSFSLMAASLMLAAPAQADSQQKDYWQWIKNAAAVEQFVESLPRVGQYAPY